MVVEERQTGERIAESDECPGGVLQTQEVSVGHLVSGGNRESGRRGAIDGGPRLPVKEEEAFAVAII